MAFGNPSAPKLLKNVFLINDTFPAISAYQNEGFCHGSAPESGQLNQVKVQLPGPWLGREHAPGTALTIRALRGNGRLQGGQHPGVSTRRLSHKQEEYWNRSQYYVPDCHILHNEISVEQNESQQVIVPMRVLGKWPGLAKEIPFRALHRGAWFAETQSISENGSHKTQFV